MCVFYLLLPHDIVFRKKHNHLVAMVGLKRSRRRHNKRRRYQKSFICLYIYSKDNNEENNPVLLLVVTLRWMMKLLCIVSYIYSLFSEFRVLHFEDYELFNAWLSLFTPNPLSINVKFNRNV